MKKIINFCKQLRLSQILTVFLATLVLFFNTACNSGNTQGARPNNPPVQAGGANNPYKSGGDNNTNFNFSPDPKVSGKSVNPEGKRADSQIISNQLIAEVEKLYPGAQKPGMQKEIEKALPKIAQEDFQSPEPGGQIQRESNIGSRVKDRLSAVKETFDEASDFIHDSADEALEKHEASFKPGAR